MKHFFSISPRILSHFGEDLIKNESIALFELIKNSYDACASTCIIEFYFNENKLEKISIEDDGTGMDKSTIENVWLVVGTPNKRDNLYKNKCGRMPLGEKGIGRLSVHKLGNKITLFSKSKNDNEVELFIDWNKLPDAERIEEFTIDVLENETPKIFKSTTGTKIIIED